MEIDTPFYDRTMKHPLLQQGSDLDAIVNMKTTLWAFNTMLASLLAKGEVVGPETQRGICGLIEQHCFQLNGLAEAIFEKAWSREQKVTAAARKLRHDLIASGTKAGADADTIGAAMNIPAATIEEVVSQLRGEAAPRPKAARAAGASDAR